MSCVICCDKFNRSNRKLVSCLHCEFEACCSCCQTYMVNESSSRCMNPTKHADGSLVCGKEWPRKFLVDNFSKKFLTVVWKETLEKIGFDREKALLPATQGYVEQQIAKEGIRRKIHEVELLMVELGERRHNLLRELHNGGDFRANIERRFIRACPVEECRGYLSTAWKCGLCEQWTCPECHVVKTEGTDHVCKEDDLATAKLLDEDTKPCPKCSEGIFKIEGCDQMWCTQCHTAFSWRTGFIENKVHNPHFYEWQRRNNNGVAPRVEGDIVCGRELDHRSVNNIRTYLTRIIGAPLELENESIQLQRKISNVVQSCLHLQHVHMGTYTVDNVKDNLYLRVDFLRNRITEEQFKVLVQRANKKNDKHKEIGGVLRLFLQTVTDIIYRIQEALRITRVQTNKAGGEFIIKEIDTMINEVDVILSYCNECLEDTARTYGSKKLTMELFSNDRGGDRRVLF